MKSKQILSIILVLVIVFAMAATACGKKEDTAEKEEPNQEETSDTDEASADEVEKTIDDTLTEEDIQSLKGSIRDAVISEYLEPNNISAEDFTWPDKDSGEWGYMVDLNTNYYLAYFGGYEIDDMDDMDDIMEIDSSSYSNPEIMEAAFNGIIYWHKHNKQGRDTDTFFHNVYDAVSPYNEVIPTIDLASK